VSLNRRIKDVVNAFAASHSEWVSALPRALKSAKRNGRRSRQRARLRSGDVDFVTLDELAIWTREFVGQLTEDYDAVIGIPRSGLIVASIVATKLGRPLTTPELYREGRFWTSRLLAPPDPAGLRSVLLIDDSVDHGSTIEAAKARIEGENQQVRITTAALIAHRPAARELVDLHHCVLPHPTIFEWNLMHAKAATDLSMSLEGVLDRRDGIPAYAIDAVLARGRESERAAAAAWLRSRGVRYDELVMLEGRSRAEVVAGRRPDLHIEGSLAEATAIWRASGVPTISLHAMELVGSLR
jgi:hypoxanthine phosphoribosyltransferase